MNSIRIRCCLLLAAAALVAIFFAVLAPQSRAQNPPPGMPPDIAAILARIKSGQTPTASDIQKLQAYGQAMANAHGDTSATTKAKNGVITNKTIPCSVVCTLSWKHKYQTGESSDTTINETGSLNVRCDAQLVVAIHGTGDYYKNVLNPAVETSMFRFQGMQDANGQPIATGDGQFTYRSESSENQTQASGYYSSGAACGFVMTTTGIGNALYVSGKIGGKITGNKTVTVNNKTKNYDGIELTDLAIDAPFPHAPSDPQPKPGEATPQSPMKFSYSQLVNAIKTGRTTSISSGESFSYNLGTAQRPDQFSGNSTLSITLRPTPGNMIIEPGDPEVYKKWIPHVDKLDSKNTTLFGDPKPFPVHVAIMKGSTSSAQGAGPTKPTGTVGGTIEISLVDVSDAKGVCMNYPQDATTQKSLYFPKKQPDGIKYIDDQHVETTSPSAIEASVLVACRDTAAYGSVTAECKNLGFLATYQRTGKQALALPMDDNNNHIADAWEKDPKVNIYDKNYPPDWDGENQPSTWSVTGDGVTLFEEYRGFLTDDGSGNESFTRLKPGNPMKIFLYLTAADKALHKKGVELYQATTGVQPIYLNTTSRMESYNDPFPKWVNFNETLYTKMKQCAVWVDDTGGNILGTAKLDQDEPEQNAQTPQTVWKLNISRAACTSQVNFWASVLPPRTQLAKVPQEYIDGAKSAGIDLVKMGDDLVFSRPLLVNRLIVFTTMHELGHATGARHHALDAYLAFDTSTHTSAQNAAFQAQCYSGGDPNCPMRYWHFSTNKSEVIQFMSGNWDLTAPAKGGHWQFCPSDLRTMGLLPDH